MKKKNVNWTIKILEKEFKNIEFPEFQREPSVWDLTKKRKLVDSILRNFDIASIYLYKRSDGIFECIDGRQRINAIISFLGLNEDNESFDDKNINNNFKFVSSDDLLGTSLLKDYNQKSWTDFTTIQKNGFLNYQFNIIEITDIEQDSEELNLMFLRLQLGVPLNAGEKLNAMVGDMKDFIFRELSNHAYFNFLNIPQRRFSKQLTASQIAINFFSLQNDNQFERARFIDLQEFYKRYLTFSSKENSIARLLIKRLDETFFNLPKDNSLVLKNRAIGISVFFFINNLIEKGGKENIKLYIKFMKEFLKRLKSQVEKGIDIEKQYRDLLKFQNYISQAAVEKYAIENRHAFLKDYFEFYKKNGKIKGDK